MMVPPRTSKHWIPDIQDLCDTFYKTEVNAECVAYDVNKLRDMDADCDKMVDIIKKEIFFDIVDQTDCRIDRHKVGAIHVICFLRNPPFKCDLDSPNVSFYDILAKVL